MFFRVDYATCMRLCGVRTPEPHRYVWRDPLGNRQFECVNKKKVLVPFSSAAHACKIFNLHPILVDPEPDWSAAPPSSSSPPGHDATSHGDKVIPPLHSSRNTSLSGKDAIPVVVLLGHINHGKTTLLDRIAGTLIAPFEAGGITQNISGVTVTFPASAFLHVPRRNQLENSREDEREEREKAVRVNGRTSSRLNRDTYGERGAEKEEEEEKGKKACGREEETKSTRDVTKLTFIDTPGHETFYAMRGRASACADIACIVIDVTEGRRVQTEEVLLLADEFNLPVVIVINKIDKLLSQEESTSSFSQTFPTSFSLLSTRRHTSNHTYDDEDCGTRTERRAEREKEVEREDSSREAERAESRAGRKERREKEEQGEGKKDVDSDADIQLVKMELRRQHQKLREKGLIKRDLSHDIMNAVCISALYGYGIEVRTFQRIYVLVGRVRVCISLNVFLQGSLGPYMRMCFCVY